MNTKPKTYTKGDSQTKVVGSVNQIRCLITFLETAIYRAENDNTTQWVRFTAEQVEHDGPWRLVIGVYPHPTEEET